MDALKEASGGSYMIHNSGGQTYTDNLSNIVFCKSTIMNLNKKLASKEINDKFNENKDGGRTLEQFFSASRYTLLNIIFINMKIMCNKVCLDAEKNCSNVLPPLFQR